MSEKIEVIHPLDDIQEEKLNGKNLGTIEMTPKVKFLLLLLRIYTISVVLILVTSLIEKIIK